MSAHIPELTTQDPKASGHIKPWLHLEIRKGKRSGEAWSSGDLSGADADAGATTDAGAGTGRSDETMETHKQP